MGKHIKMVTLKDGFFKALQEDEEILQHRDAKFNYRPFLIPIQMWYKGQRIHFAIPLRSNITASSPDEQYVSLPTRATTKPNHAHGLHIIKMFPVQPSYFNAYNPKGDIQDQLLRANIAKRLPEIVQKAKEYIKEYERGNKNRYSPDWDKIIDIHYKPKRD